MTRSGLPLLVLCGLALAAPAFAQSPTEPSQDEQATELGDVVVSGLPVQRTSRAFVEAVAAPASGRKAAAWRGRICVGVTGLRPEIAQPMADRVLDWGASLGLQTGNPGCEPNIFVVMTDDGDATARALVESRPREFRTGISSMTPNGAALETFQTSGKKVRWWHVSIPVNASTGAPIIRLPGQPPFAVSQEIRTPADLGSFGNAVESSLINDRSRDDLTQIIIVVEMAAFDVANFNQVSDLVAMAALAQITPDTVPPTPSILTLFDTTRAQEPTLSRWDRAYLQSLYDPGTVAAGGTPRRVAEGMAERVAAEADAPPSAP